MKIAVINGSPKGNLSATAHSLFYLERLNKADKFSYIDAGQKVKAYTKDISQIKDAIEEADLIIFSYPVYTFIAPFQAFF